MTEMARRGNELQLAADAEYWTERQVASLRAMGMPASVTHSQLAVFHHVCQRTGLDPFARQIYMVEYAGKPTIQTGIDGFRLVARRAVAASGETLSMGSAEWCDAEGKWTDVWLGEGNPSAARITVFRNGEPFPAIALWREYVQTKRDGNITSMWRTRPAGQLAKCAEALGLRKAFPQDLSGVYTEDELNNNARGVGEIVEHRPVTVAEVLRVEPVAVETPDEAVQPEASFPVSGAASSGPDTDPFDGPDEAFFAELNAEAE